MKTKVQKYQPNELVYHPHYGVLLVVGYEQIDVEEQTIDCLVLHDRDTGTRHTIPQQHLQEISLQPLQVYAEAACVEKALRLVITPPKQRLRGKYNSIPQADEKLQQGVVELAKLIRDLNDDEERTFAVMQHLTNAARRLRDVLAYYWQCAPEDAATRLNAHLATHGRPQLDFTPMGRTVGNWNQRMPQ